MPKAPHSPPLPFPAAPPTVANSPVVVSSLRAFTKKQPLGMIGGGMLLILVFLALTAPLLMPFDPYEPHIPYKYASPGTLYTETGQHFWLGADQLGRDIMTRLVYGARITLFVSLISVSYSGAGHCGHGRGVVA
jgi:ABC-type dipeptide/oligopeptide/nickel transport system permease subunit